MTTWRAGKPDLPLPSIPEDFIRKLIFSASSVRKVMWKYVTPARCILYGLCVIFGALVFLTIFISPSNQGSDRAYCILNQRNVQQAVRGIQNIHHLKPGDTIVWDEIFGLEGLISSKPKCPTDGNYTLANVIPGPGILVCPCKNPKHRPDDTESW